MVNFIGGLENILLLINMKKQSIKLAIGIPNCGTIKSQTAFALIRMLKDFPYDYNVIFQQGSILHQNRENIVKEATKQKCTHLLFIDSDMFFEADSVMTLLGRDKDIVGVNSHLRKFPITSTIQMPEAEKLTLKEDHPDGFFKVNAVTTAFLLIKLDVFKKLDHPWFFWEVNKDGETVLGEDYWFCRLAKEKGYEIWVDLSVKIGHVGDYTY